MSAKPSKGNKPLGLRLLKKGQRGVLRMIFGRLGIILVLLLLNVLLLFGLFAWFGEFVPHFFGGSFLFTLGMVIYIINTRMDPTAKITWLVVITLLPVFGSLLYIFTRTELGHRAMRRQLQRTYAASRPEGVRGRALSSLGKQSPGSAALAGYVGRVTGLAVSGDTAVTYFPSGEEMLVSMLDELKRAKTSIYLEYFIIDEGEMWGQILEILAQKAAEGVDVRVMYDGTCEFHLLPRSYPKKLQALGIPCRVFAPVTPFLSTHYNYRDHRKIMAIDNRVAFTGGVNLADEYINAIHPYGYWKDVGVRVEGTAAKQFQEMFLQLWHLQDKDPYPGRELHEEPPVAGLGYVLPYYEDPLKEEQVARQVYIDMLNRAEEYVYIMTPYLVLDNELESALTYAAKRGVRVVMLLPGVPDHKAAHLLAKRHFPVLVEAGVLLYEYTPGFVHAKVVVADGREATVGTVNFDYRSLYHHFECGIYLQGAPCIPTIIKDFEESVARSAPITRETLQREKWHSKLAGSILKLIAPLM